MRLICEANILKKFVDSARIFDSEPTVLMQDAGISMITMDTSKSVLLHLGIKKEVFDVYEAEKEVEVCFNFDDMSKYLGGASGIAEFFFDLEKSVAVVRMASEHGRKEFELPLLEPETPSLVPSELPFTSRCKVTVRALMDATRDASRVGSRFCYIEPDGSDLLVYSKGERSSVKNRLVIGKGVIASDFVEGDKVILFVDHLKQGLESGYKFTNVVLMKFGIDIPALLDFQLPFEGVCKVYLAPCIEPKR